MKRLLGLVTLLFLLTVFSQAQAGTIVEDAKDHFTHFQDFNQFDANIESIRGSIRQEAEGYSKIVSKKIMFRVEKSRTKIRNISDSGFFESRVDHDKAVDGEVEEILAWLRVEFTEAFQPVDIVRWADSLRIMISVPEKCGELSQVQYSDAWSYWLASTLKTGLQIVVDIYVPGFGWVGSLVGHITGKYLGVYIGVAIYDSQCQINIIFIPLEKQLNSQFERFDVFRTNEYNRARREI